jgi:hypothetical protein
MRCQHGPSNKQDPHITVARHPQRILASSRMRLLAAIKEHLAFTPAASISSSPIDLLPAHASVAYAQAGPQRGG